MNRLLPAVFLSLAFTSPLFASETELAELPVDPINFQSVDPVNFHWRNEDFVRYQEAGYFNEYVGFSKDGKKWAYSMKTEEGRFYVVNGVKYGPYKRIGEPAAFSDDSRRFIFSASREDRSGWIVNVDGEEHGGDYSWISPPVFSPNSRDWFAVASKKPLKRSDVPASYLLINGVVRGPYESVVDGDPEMGEYHGNIVFSERGDHFAYRFTVLAGHPVFEEGTYAVIDDKIFGPYRALAVGVRDIALDDEGRHAFFVNEKKPYIMRDGQRENLPAFCAPDATILVENMRFIGGELAYKMKCLWQGKNYFIREGKETPLTPDYHAAVLNNNSGAAFSKDLKHFARTEGSGGTFMNTGAHKIYRVVRDGKPGKKYPVANLISGIFYLNIHYMTFSPDGNHLAYRVRKPSGRFILVVDEKERGEYDYLCNFRFSEDSRFLFCSGIKGRKLLSIAIEL